MAAVDPLQDVDADQHAFARAIALRQLDVRPRSRWELEQKMRSKNVPEDVMGAVLNRLSEVGLIDDRAYAHLFVRSKTSTKRLARMALRIELRKRGIADDLIAQAVDEISHEDEVSMARTLVEKKLPSLKRFSHEVRYRRLAGLLGRKGYSHGVIRLVLADLD